MAKKMLTYNDKVLKYIVDSETKIVGYSDFENPVQEGDTLTMTQVYGASQSGDTVTLQ